MIMVRGMWFKHYFEATFGNFVILPLLNMSANMTGAGSESSSATDNGVALQSLFWTRIKTRKNKLCNLEICQTCFAQKTVQKAI